MSRLHTFQACSFNHSDTSPRLETHYLRFVREALAHQNAVLQGPARIQDGASAHKIDEVAVEHMNAARDIIDTG